MIKEFCDFCGGEVKLIKTIDKKSGKYHHICLACVKATCEEPLYCEHECEKSHCSSDGGFYSWTVCSLTGEDCKRRINYSPKVCLIYDELYGIQRQSKTKASILKLRKAINSLAKRRIAIPDYTLRELDNMANILQEEAGEEEYQHNCGE